jgi:hypothetical protein
MQCALHYASTALAEAVAVNAGQDRLVPCWEGLTARNRARSVILSAFRSDSHPDTRRYGLPGGTLMFGELSRVLAGTRLSCVLVGSHRRNHDFLGWLRPTVTLLEAAGRQGPFYWTTSTPAAFTFGSCSCAPGGMAASPSVRCPGRSVRPVARPSPCERWGRRQPRRSDLLVGAEPVPAHAFCFLSARIGCLNDPQRSGGRDGFLVSHRIGRDSQPLSAGQGASPSGARIHCSRRHDANSGVGQINLDGKGNYVALSRGSGQMVGYTCRWITWAAAGTAGTTPL